ncbi:MAG: ABC transporter permease [Lysobacteraceae bacterium]
MIRRTAHLPGTLWFGLALCALVLLPGIVALWWTPWDPERIAVTERLLSPSASHWLGTDHLGRDLASMLMAGACSTLGIALAAVFLGMLIGVPLGLWAATRRGWVDELLMRANDLLFAFPALLLAILLAAALGPGAWNAVLAIGLFSVPVFARVVRAGVLSLWLRDFVLAARLAGKGGWRISFEHILPNLTGLIVVQASLQLSLGVLAEAGLSYVGLGTQPPAPSWGRMLNEAQTLTAIAPHLALLPGLCIALAVLGLNLVGDGLRQRFDPRTWQVRQ